MGDNGKTPEEAVVDFRQRVPGAPVLGAPRPVPPASAPAETGHVASLPNPTEVVERAPGKGSPAEAAVDGALPYDLATWNLSQDRPATAGDVMDAMYRVEQAVETGRDVEAARAVLRIVRSSFEAAHGTVRDWYTSGNRRSIVLWTTQGLHMTQQDVVQDAEDVEELFFVLDGLYHDVMELRRGRAGQPSGGEAKGLAPPHPLERRLYNIATHLMHQLDRIAGAPTGPPERAPMMAVYKRELADIAGDLKEHQQREAKRQYLLGLVVGEVAVALLCLMLLAGARAATAGSAIGPVGYAMAGAVVAGGLGAGVSVLTRVGSDKLAVNHHHGWGLVRAFGGFRAVVGGVMGLVLQAMVASGLVPVAVPTGEAQAFLFVFSLAFVAGFSERYARDMIMVSAKRAGGSGEPDGE